MLLPALPDGISVAARVAAANRHLARGRCVACLGRPAGACRRFPCGPLCAACAGRLFPGVRVLGRLFDLPRSAFDDEGGPIRTVERRGAYALFTAAFLGDAAREALARGPPPADLLPPSRARSRYALDEGDAATLARHGRLARVSEAAAAILGAARHGSVDAALATGRRARKRTPDPPADAPPAKRVRKGPNPLLALPDGVLAEILGRVAEDPPSLVALSRVDRGTRAIALAETGLWRNASEALPSGVPDAWHLSARARVVLACSDGPTCALCRRRVVGIETVWEYGARACPRCLGEGTIDEWALARAGLDVDGPLLGALPRKRGTRLMWRALVARALRAVDPAAAEVVARPGGTLPARPCSPGLAPSPPRGYDPEAALEAALADAALERRADSRLCDAWVAGRSAMSLDDVVSVSAEMRVLYDHLGYAQLIDAAWGELRKEGLLRVGVRVDPEDVKDAAYERVGARRPLRMVWLTDRKMEGPEPPPPLPGRWERAKEVASSRYGGRARVYGCLGLAVRDDGEVEPLAVGVAAYVERGDPIS